MSVNGRIANHYKRMSTSKKIRDLSVPLAAAAIQDHIARDLSLHCAAAPPVGTSAASHCARNKQSVARRRPKEVSSLDKRAASRSQAVCLQTQGRCARSEAEYVLDARKFQPLSLAQRLGLVESLAAPLSEAEWSVVKATSLARGDSYQPCPVCQAEYGLQEQVLLSCSHTFHKACLLAFERHSGKKCCPMCRKADYQIRVIYEGARLCREKAVARIQAAWRGYKARCWYTEYRKRVPPRDPSLRKKYFERKLASLTDQIVDTQSATQCGVDMLLERVDKNMADSRTAMKLLDLKLSRCAINWNETKKRAETSLTSDCAVCLAPLVSRPHKNRPLNLVPRPHRDRRLALLSCTHVLHLACIQAMEQFTVHHIPLCPICRAPYERSELVTPYQAS